MLGDVIDASIEVQGVAMAKAGRGQSARALEAGSVEALYDRPHAHGGQPSDVRGADS